jgi:hypothetical protein
VDRPLVGTADPVDQARDANRTDHQAAVRPDRRRDATLRTRQA